jgi:hypothetical protein
MEQLRDTLVFNDALVDDWTFDRTEQDGLKMRFTINAKLPKELAEALRCTSIYDDDTGKMELLHKLKDTEILFPTPGLEGDLTSIFPDVIYKFKATRDDTAFRIACNVHVSSRVDELHEIFKAYEDGITVTVRPRQGELFDGGTRVEMSEGTQKNGGMFEENNCEPEDQQPNVGPVLVTAREAVGKTPGRKGRKATRPDGVDLTEEDLAVWNGIRQGGGQGPIGMDEALAILQKQCPTQRQKMLQRIGAASMDKADQVGA